MRRGSWIAVALLMLLATSKASAHLVTPTSTAMRPGTSDYIYVADLFSCQATITATVADTLVAKIYEVNMATGATVPGNGKSVTVPNRIDQVFLVEGSSIVVVGTTNITVCWTGVDWPGPGACVEQNCPTGVNVAVNVSDFPATTGNYAGRALIRDPINTATGEVILPEKTHLALGGPMDLRFATYYGSLLAADGDVVADMGPNWTHNYDWALTFPGNQLEVVDPKGRVIRFEKGFFDTTWTQVGVKDFPFQLVESGSNYIFGNSQNGLMYTFGPAGRLLSIEDGPGNVLTCSYTGFNYLSQVADGLGRMLTY
ncbi:MAG: hypothetical protein HKN20_00460, partial [Gemmatimonadetes bacterium]|nr:hypothetical protein [Gemmatimonadota bacterium]